jgi:hypothetical protein
MIQGTTGSHRSSPVWPALMAAALATLSACQGDPKEGTPAESTSVTAGGPPITIEPRDLIDDFTDGDNSISWQEGRKGIWYTYADARGMGTLTPAPDQPVTPTGGGPSGNYLSVRGGGFVEYVGFGFQFNNPDGQNPMPYDLSAYRGIAFLARGSGSLQVGIGTREVLPTSQGGTCPLPIPPAASTCNDVHAAAFPLRAEWEQKRIPWAALRQEGFGAKVAFQPAAALSVQFDAIAPGTSFEIAIDDVGLFR